jgi:acetyl-CoA C-acetyltransferase
VATNAKIFEEAQTMPILEEVFIFDAIRTPRGRGKPTGALHTQTPISLVVTLLDELRRRYPGIDRSVDEIVLGCCEQLNDQGGNLARSAALQARYSTSTPGLMVSRFCGSGLDAVNVAVAKVMSGQTDLVIAGGVEMLSLFSIFGSGGPMISDVQFKDQTVQIPQGISADLIATMQGYSRNDVDSFAALSQQRAHRAWEQGLFSHSVVPVPTATARLERDELVRSNVTTESLAGLKPSFEKAGETEGYGEIIRFRYPRVGRLNYVHHAGNSSGIADGAGLVVIGNREVSERLGIHPRARILSTASAADDPCIMLTAPAEATSKALRRVGLRFSDIDIYEVNEAFASVVLYFMEKTKVPHEKVNPVGGAIAMGHPVGATGAMLIGTLIDEMQRREFRRGAVTMCTGLGMGVATILETV